ncbi:MULTISPECIES: hypothetical protein [unclassified Methanoculleus]|jgi:hypothetical protein|uniref:Uncharacterized protein n=1 Tax=Methanoculleus palmolei TaxID=72612 RepID=A0ABD8A802_9EURY|nr:hypothetical protein [Methanoculleus sp. UBA377]WOX55643.1 hypothetical protein R6Y95_09240 [Methanoculleus palmolei]
MATLLVHALKGAALAGAETEFVHFYDLDFRECARFFACKMKGGKNRTVLIYTIERSGSACRGEVCGTEQGQRACPASVQRRCPGNPLIERGSSSLLLPV